MTSKVFHLMRGEEILGVLRSYEANFPWLNCNFEALKGFDEIEPLFKAELALLEFDDIDVWEESYEKINALDLKLVDIDQNERIENFLLHIEGNEAWFRF